MGSATNNGYDGGSGLAAAVAVAEPGRRQQVPTLRARGSGQPQLSRRLLYSFYLFTPVQLTSVHPRLLTLPSSPARGFPPRGSAAEPPVYVYVGGRGLYETGCVAVRFAAQGKPPIVCTDTSVVYLKATSANNDDNNAEPRNPKAAAAKAAEASTVADNANANDDDDDDDDDDGSATLASGLSSKVTATLPLCRSRKTS